MGSSISKSIIVAIKNIKRKIKMKSRYSDTYLEDNIQMKDDLVILIKWIFFVLIPILLIIYLL